MGLASWRPGKRLLQHFLRNDVDGPMCRTVEEVARVMDVIAGFDPADQITANARGHIPATFWILEPDGLQSSASLSDGEVVGDSHLRGLPSGQEVSHLPLAALPLVFPIRFFDQSGQVAQQ